MHYIGMAAVSFIRRHRTPPTEHSISISGLGTASIALVSIVILCLVYLSAFIDRRFMLHARRWRAAKNAIAGSSARPSTPSSASPNDGTITDWNRQAGRRFGWTAEEAIGKPVGELSAWTGDHIGADRLPGCCSWGRPASRTYGSHRPPQVRHALSCGDGRLR